MKMAKAIRQQAATAERVAVNTADTYVAGQMRTLAQAFKIQAEIIKKNKKRRRKNEFFDQSEVPTRRSRPPQEDGRSRAQEGPGNVARRLLRPLHHDAGRAGLPLFRVRRFAAHSRRCASAPENPPARQANSDVASREIAPRSNSQTGTKCDQFDYPLLIRKFAHGRRYALATAYV